TSSTSTPHNADQHKLTRLDTRPTGVPSTIPAAQPHDPVSRPTTQLRNARIADQRVLRLIDRWLAAGVIEDEQWSASGDGCPQGASISPLLANLYLHHVFDLWADWWRKQRAHGDVIIVRFADDLIAGFEYERDARRFWAELGERFAKFGLELHPDKTRLIEFGRHAARNRKARGGGKPETFNFLGFTPVFRMWG